MLSRCHANLLKSEDLAVLVGGYPARQFPLTRISYKIYEPQYYWDDHRLSFSVAAPYSWKFTHSFFQLPLSLIREFCEALKAYDPQFSGLKDLACLEERAGSRMRRLIQQDHHDLILRTELLDRTGWGIFSCLKITSEQYPATINLLRWFAVAHLDEIKASYERRRQEGREYASYIPRQ